MARAADLERAVALAAAGDWDACLAALVAAWRADREPILAEAIDHVAARAAHRVCGPREIGARIAAATAADVSEILATIRREVRTRPHFAAHARDLADAVGPDPRVAELLAELVVRSPFARGVGVLDRETVDRLAAIDDPRNRDTIVRERDRLLPRKQFVARRKPQLAHLATVCADIAARPPPPPATREVRAALAAIAAALAAPTRATAAAGDRDALFAAVYANPLDDAPRLVLADVLQAAGDPRGEFIALQLARAATDPPSRRERALLATHARAWLGAAEPFLLKQGVVFRRGFLAAGRLSVNGFFTAPTDRAWHTVEALDCNHAWDTEVATWLPTLPALRDLASFYHSDLPTLLAATRHAPLAWTSFGMRYFTRDDLALLAASAAHFPHLATLDLSHVPLDVAHLGPFVASPFAQRLQHLRAAAPVRGLQADALAAYLDRARALHVRTVELVPAFELAPIAEGPAVVVDLHAATAAPIARKPALAARYHGPLRDALPATYRWLAPAT